MSETSETTSSLLDERYGTATKRGLDKRVAWVSAGLLVAAGIAFLLFGGWHTTSDLEYRTISYEVLDEKTVTVKGQVTVSAGTDAVCALEALSESYATVGWRLIDLPASENRTRSIDEAIVTTSPATTGSVRECWALEP